ncbi:hypothetical protein [Sunxiuqinia sp. sy24]|uniref:hypothetical protein n=1 Tax=Sunxiuqinia sp. sy24 TaxID=3461495 RepID=UPI00404544CE
MENEELKKRICSLDDAGLKRLLSLRDSYQPEAVEIAICEAIDRQLIESEEELQSKRFQEESHPKTLFPYLHHEKQFQKVFGSLIRTLYLVAVIPLIYGALKVVEAQQRDGLVMLGLGLLWIGLSIRMQKRQQAQIPFVLMGVFLVGLIHVFISRPSHLTWQVSDFVVLGIAVLLVFYLLSYLRVLLTRKQHKE